MIRMRKMSLHSKGIIILVGCITVFSSILFSLNSSYALNNTGSIEVNVYYTNSDTVSSYGQILKVYQDTNSTAYKVISPDHYPLTIGALPLGHQYKIDVYKFNMYASSTYVNLQNTYEKIDLLIPLDAGVRFNVFYNDGLTPIDNATVSIKSQDGIEWASGNTDYKGSTTRFWIQPTIKDGNYYTATFSIGQNFTYTYPTQITLVPTSQPDIKIVIPWSAHVDSFLVNVYDSASHKIVNLDKTNFAVLTDNIGNIIVRSPIDYHGQVYFTNIKPGNYVVHIMKTSKNFVSLIEVASKKVVIRDNAPPVNIYIQNAGGSAKENQNVMIATVGNNTSASLRNNTSAIVRNDISAPAITIQMNDSHTSYGLSTYSGVPIHTEYVSGTSSLVGKSIDTIVTDLRTGGYVNGTVQVGVFNDDLSVKQLFGTIDASNILPSYAQYSFSLPTPQTYQIQSGDRIGIKFDGGNSSNFVAIMTDQNDTFDGTNSYHTYFEGTKWVNDDAVDLSMILERDLNPAKSSLIPPQDILSVTTNSSRNIQDLGTPTLTYNGSSPVFTNNSTGQFPIGITKILWRVTDSQGNKSIAIQKVTVIHASPPTDQFDRVAMINFDDIPESIFTLGKPVLDKYNIKTTQFVVCSFVGTANYYMTWPQILQMQSEGHDIQSHTMTHFHAKYASSERMDYEYGQSKPCLTDHGIANVHILAEPYYEGYKNVTAINTIAKYYDFSRGGPGDTFYLHCNYPSTTQTDCRTFDSDGNLNLFNRYNIRTWSSDDSAAPVNFNDTSSFERFISEVNSATTNTSYNPVEIPILLYHKVVQDNSIFVDSRDRGTSVKLLDAEMKYLRDNNFTIYTTKDLKYDTDKNWFYFDTSADSATVPEFGPTVFLIFIVAIAAIIAISAKGVSGLQSKL